MSETQSTRKTSSKFSRSMNKLENYSSSARNSQILNSSSSTSLNHEIDFDTFLSKENGRKLFTKFLKEFNNSLDNMLTVYLIMSCFQNKDYIEKDSERIKQILERTYNSCFVKNDLTHLSPSLKAKLGESLQKKICDESIFNAVKKELRNLLENEYFPMFLQSKFFKDNMSKKMINNKNADTISLNEEYATISDIYGNESESHEYANIKDLVSNADDDKKSIKNGKQSKIPSGIFAMPNIPSLKTAKQNQTQASDNRMLKQSKSSSSSTSSVLSTASNSKRSIPNRHAESGNVGVKHSHSKLSLSNELSGYNQSTRSKMPPNPYHVATKAIPVSAQDSEIQSTVSADFTNEDHAMRFSKNLHEMSSLSCSKNSLQSRLPRPNREMAANLIANKDVELNMPEFKQEQSDQPLRKNIDPEKLKPLSELNPEEFFNLLSAKLEKIAIRDEDENEQVPDNYNEVPEFTFKENLETKLSIPVESDMDSHIDEHINRVYNSSHDNKSQLFNSVLNNSTFHDSQNLTSTNAKMFKVSSLHNKISNKSLNLTKNNQEDYNFNGTLQEQMSSFYHNQSVNQNNSISIHKAPKLNTSLATSQSRNNKCKSKDVEENSHHHFYKLTSTSKEVDIDHHTHQIEDSNINKKSNNSFAEHSLMKKSHSRHDNVNKSAIANFKSSKQSKGNTTSDMNYDSGVSIRSAASIERVNDWLSNSGYQPNNRDNNETIKNNKKSNEKTKTLNKEISADNSCKTTVAYYLPGEDVAYISTFSGKSLTLSQFKQLITKKGHFRYFFKTRSDLLDDEECVVFQEATDDNAFVPMFNSKVIAKIEKYNEN